MISCGPGSFPRASMPPSTRSTSAGPMACIAGSSSAGRDMPSVTLRPCPARMAGTRPPATSWFTCPPPAGRLNPQAEAEEHGQRRLQEAHLDRPAGRHRRARERRRHPRRGHHLATDLRRGPAGMSTNDQTKPSLADRGAPGTSKRPEAVTDNRSMGELVVDVSEKTSYLIREEIELAKAEVTEKVTKLVKGSVVGIVAGVFILMSLAMFMHGIAWLLNELFFEDDVWIGF